MSNLKLKDKSAEVQFKNIEVWESNIFTPQIPFKEPAIYNFNINFSCQADPKNKLVFGINTVEVRSQDNESLLGKIVISCAFEIVNFEQIISIENEKIDVPDELLRTLNIITLGTTRGVMFSTFKGTYLHNAILPLVDPSGFVASMEQNTSTAE